MGSRKWFLFQACFPTCVNNWLKEIITKIIVFQFDQEEYETKNSYRFSHYGSCGFNYFVFVLSNKKKKIKKKTTHWKQKDLITTSGTRGEVTFTRNNIEVKTN